MDANEMIKTMIPGERDTEPCSNPDVKKNKRKSINNQYGLESPPLDPQALSS